MGGSKTRARYVTMPNAISRASEERWHQTENTEYCTCRDNVPFGQMGFVVELNSRSRGFKRRWMQQKNLTHPSSDPAQLNLKVCHCSSPSTKNKNKNNLPKPNPNNQQKPEPKQPPTSLSSPTNSEPQNDRTIFTYTHFFIRAGYRFSSPTCYFLRGVELYVLVTAKRNQVSSSSPRIKPICSHICQFVNTVRVVLGAFVCSPIRAAGTPVSKTVCILTTAVTLAVLSNKSQDAFSLSAFRYALRSPLEKGQHARQICRVNF